MPEIQHLDTFSGLEKFKGCKPPNINFMINKYYLYAIDDHYHQQTDF